MRILRHRWFQIFVSGLILLFLVERRSSPRLTPTICRARTQIAFVGQYSGGTGYGGGDPQSVEVEQSQGLVTEADGHLFGF